MSINRRFSKDTCCDVTRFIGCPFLDIPKVRGGMNAGDCGRGACERHLKIIPQEVIERDYGCGYPSQWFREGETLGSSTGNLFHRLPGRACASPSLSQRPNRLPRCGSEFLILIPLELPLGNVTCGPPPHFSEIDEARYYEFVVWKN